MKIALFIKPSIAKVCFSFLLIISVVGQPAYAYAGFFSNLVTKVLGTETQAAEIPVIEDTNTVIHNSQTLPLPESSINPDLKNIKEVPAVTIVSDEALLPNVSLLGNDDSELEKYTSTEKIDVYIVKKGDTLGGIANKLKVSKDAIIASNTDLKKENLLKVGQSLVIIGLKSGIAKAETDTSKDGESEKVVTKAKDTPTEKPIVKEEKKDEGPMVTINTDLIKTQVKEEQPPTVTLQLPSVQAEVKIEAPESNGQPTGTINGGYIWPFPEGVGRVSQGRHADNAYDFAAPKNTPIYAVQSGSVLISHPTGYNGGFGKYVVIDFTDGRQAIFAHMNTVVAKEGDVVKQGDIIGYVGSTGKSTGPHTHIGFHGPLSNPYLGLKVNSTNIDHD